MAGNNRISNHIFHSNTTVTGTGTEYITNGQSDEMYLFFSISSGGTFTAITEGYNYTANKWVPWDVYQIPSYTECSVGITDATKAYNLSVKGVDKIRVSITALTGTFSCNATVVG